MPTEAKYLMEGMPFEERCTRARERLSGFQQTVEKASNASLRNAHQLRLEIEKDIENTEEPIGEQVSQALTISTEALVGAAWARFVEACRILYGTDAVDFAVSTLNNERKTN